MSPWRKMHQSSEFLWKMLQVGRHVGKDTCHITSPVGLQDRLTHPCLYSTCVEKIKNHWKIQAI